MRIRCWSLVVLGGLVLVAALQPVSPAYGEERHLEFLKGLRELRFFDYALLFLDQLDARTDLDPALKEVLTYERARTLLEGAEQAPTPDAQLKQLDSATVYLQQFVKASPNHPLAAEANSELAEVLVRKGRVEVNQSRIPANLPKKAEHQAKARGYFAEARKKYQEAYDLYTKHLESLSKGYLDPVKEKAERDDREKTLVSQIQAEFNLNLCTYDEAQTYDMENPKRKELLLKGANDFEKLHQKHRSVVAGLYARMYQGKCFEEMGDITKALGIYNELLGHGEEESDAVLKRLQDHVLHFKLICLNHETKRDYQVVVQLGTDWLKANRDRTLRSRAGLGIRWEVARALEQLAIRAGAGKPEPPKPTEKKRKAGDAAAAQEDTEPALPESDLGNPETLYRQAEAHAKYINRYPGEYREPSSAMLKRIALALNKTQGDPREFDAAFQLALDLVKQIKPRRDALVAAQGADKAKLGEDYKRHVEESIRILKLAMSLNGPVSADKKADRENEMNRARYYLAFAYYNHPSRAYALDAALIGEYIARKYPQSAAALDAAYLSMAAYQQAYNTSDAGKRAAADPVKAAIESKTNFEILQTIAVCNYVTEKWPADEKAHDARINLGDLYLQVRRPAEAAKVFQQVPENSPRYHDARLKAGIALWDAVASFPMLPEAERPPVDDLPKFSAEARKILEDAIAQQEAKQLPDSEPGRDVTLAKLSLVQILNGTGEFPISIKLLTEGPKAVLAGAKAMQGKGGQAITVASRTELLRAYVGDKKVEKAREQLKELEKLGGTEGLTGILVNLGKELKKEIERLEAAKDQRLGEVLQSFEAFLNDLLERKEGHDYGSLMWVGQTYSALGEGLEKSDPAKAGTYFAKSGDAYQMLREKSELIPTGAAPGVTLRLVTARRREKKFDDAQKLIVELLKENPNALDIQTEAAQIYQDRAAQGGPDDWKYWDKAIAGEQLSPPNGPRMWGWYEFSEKLRNSLMSNLQAKQRTEYETKYFDVRYNTAFARLNYARNQQKDAEKEKQLKYARSDIGSTASQVERFGDRAEYAKFNELYRTIQEEYNALLEKMGRAKDVQLVIDLEKNTYTGPPAPPEGTQPPKVSETPADATPKTSPKKSQKTAKKAEPEGMSWTTFLAIPVVLILGGAVVFFVMKKPAAKKHLVRSEIVEADESPVSLGDLSKASETSKPAAPKPPPETGKPAAGAAPAKKVRTKAREA